MTFSEQQTQDLLAMEPDELYHLLGARVEAIQTNLSLSLQPTFDLEETSLEAAIPKAIKKQINAMIKRANQSTYEIVCGDDSVDDGIRNSILDALGIGEAAGVMAVTNFLVVYTGLLPVYAGIVAVIIVKKMVTPTIQAGHKNMCQIWKEKLEVS